MAIFIFDFDLTITSEHTHNKLLMAIQRGQFDPDDLEQGWRVIKDTPPTISKKIWVDLFSKLIADGHHIAIATFNDFKPLVARYLQDTLQLPEPIFKHIFVEAWLPRNAFVANKNIHIKNILQHFNETDTTSVILVDDSEFNCLAVREFGWQGIPVPSGEMDLTHIKCIEELADQLKNT